MHGEQHEVMHEVPAAKDQDPPLSQGTGFLTYSGTGGTKAGCNSG